MLAILSMDSYNRGYGAGIDLTGSALGNATLSTDSTIKLGLPTTSAAGFYAAAYSWNGKTIVSYRGTDNIDPLTVGDGASDAWVVVSTPAGDVSDIR
jgi:hypothetical protein